MKPIKIVRTSDAPDSAFAPQLAFKDDTIKVSYLTNKNYPYQKKGTLGKITFQVADTQAEGLTAVKFKFNSGRSDLSDSNLLLTPSKDLLAETKNAFISIKKGSCNAEQTFEVIQGK